MTTHLARRAAPAAVALALFVAGCGGSDAGTATAGGGTPTVSLKQLAGLGAVLVDDHGHALYASDQEADGKIRCTKGCITFWDPLPAGASGPTGASDVPGRLSTIKRADGTMQVTYACNPL